MKVNNKQYQYIIHYDGETGEWVHDVDTEEAFFYNRTIWNRDTSEYESGYLGDGLYEENEQEVNELFKKMIGENNEHRSKK